MAACGPVQIRVLAVTGKAGSGKTLLLAELVQGIEITRRRHSWLGVTYERKKKRQAARWRSSRPTNKGGHRSWRFGAGVRSGGPRLHLYVIPIAPCV